MRDAPEPSHQFIREERRDVELLDSVPRYMRNGRDLGQWVHVDVLFQAYFHAFLVLAGADAPVDDANPYQNSPTQVGFGTFGGPHIATLLCEVSTRALKAVWYQKWFVHRRLRPEAFAARVDRTLHHSANYPIEAGILNSLSTASRLGGYVTPGNALLPMAFPEGSPTHPAYGAGHGTVAGACVTILKAWFKENIRLVDLGLTPVEPADDGLTLLPYISSDAGDLTDHRLTLSGIRAARFRSGLPISTSPRQRKRLTRPPLDSFGWPVYIQPEG